MPRLRKPVDKWDKMRVLLEGQRTITGMSYAEIAAKMNLSRTSVAKRFQKPEQFTLGELLIVSVVLGIPAAELFSAVPR